MNNDDELYELFEERIAALPETERPTSDPQKYRMYGDWTNDFREKLVKREIELSELKNRPIDRQLIFNSARDKVMHLLQREAQAADLLHDHEEPLDQPSR